MINNNRTKQMPGFVEFVALMALMIALVALSIDTMLPALPQIGQELGVQRENDSQLIISWLFIGMAVGQIFYGPLSDSIGRKPAINAGLGLFIIGCLMSLFAQDFQFMLAGRLLQGIGLAGPRSVAVALVRDRFEGDAMARVMSFIMAVFILVPIIAPALGQAIILVAHWRLIFALFLLLAIIMLLWFGIRQPETLLPSQRLPFSLREIARGFREVCTTRIAFGYTMVAGLVSGAFIGYLNSAQQIFQDQYGVGTQFPLYFGLLAVGNGVASYFNARFVMRYGMKRLSYWAMLALTGLSLAFLAITYALAGHPPLWMLMTYLIVTFFAIGILFGNLNSLAMQPLGHIAGIGAAVVGSLSTFLSVQLGTMIGLAYNGTILPLVGGFAILSVISIVIMHWTHQSKE